MADTQFHGLQTQNAPNDWTLPGSLEVTLKAARAVFDGSAAVSSFLPALEIISDSGLPVGTYVASTPVSAGASADASFAPFLKGASSGAGPSTGIQFDQANTGDWLNIVTTGAAPDSRSIYLHATGDGDDVVIDTEGGLFVNDVNGYGLVFKSTTGTGGAADADFTVDEDFNVLAGRSVSISAASFLNLAASDTADLSAGGSAANALQLAATSGGIDVQIGTSKHLVIHGITSLVVLDSSVLPLADPGVSGALWNNAGVVHVSP